MLKEEVVARFKVLSWHTSEETVDKKYFKEAKCRLCMESNRKLPGCKSEAFPFKFAFSTR